MEKSKKIVLLFAVVILLPFPLSGGERFGKNFNEIVALAKKEGRVRFYSGTPDQRQAKTFFKGFREKYPEITLDYTRSQPRSHSERILAELIGGQVEYDLLTVLDVLIPKFIKAGVLAGPFDWSGIFGIRPIYVSPNKYIVGAGGSTDAIVYNPQLVPKEHVPRDWQDCLDPYWKGKMMVDTRGGSFVRLYPGWGKERLLDYARKLAANDPVWTRGITSSITLVAAGEFPMMCGAYLSSTLRFLSRHPGAPLAVSIPKEVGADLYAALTVAKEARYPNAALLLAGYLASDEGQKAYRGVFRDTPYDEGSEVARRIREAGSKVIFAGWDFTPEQQNEVTRWIIQAWGFPRAKRN